ncbi:Sensor protein FixL [Botrimarina colliarenosi]|uniref:histidine kinase n=1 Tax=Botrimarina colliarenosi TaxID=2528001 RepID=A0A5C6AJW3_9BACT|nr:ATP-binding protein [Botrimarina colliarenosi]TWT99311.1 Sensor protein FixL [Botrimarina colliarenosi]
MTALLVDPVAEAELEKLRAELREFEAAPTTPKCDPKGIDWREVINTSNDAFLSTDASGVLIEWNANAERLFGWSRDEVVGMSLDETILPGDPTTNRPGGLRLLAVDPKQGKRLEVNARCHDGGELPAEVSVTTMRHGASFVFNVFIHDISRRRELQSQLAHAQKLESIGQLSAGIAHEINTPTQYVGDNTRFVQEAVTDLLCAFEAYEALAEAVRTGGDAAAALTAAVQAAEEYDVAYLKEELGSAIDQSLEGIDRVATIVRAMKEFSHPGSAAKTPIDLAAAVQNTMTVATNEWKYVATIETDFDESLPAVPCLPGDFNQVVLNLIVNGAHAIREVVGDSGEKGVLRVATRREADEAVLSISDTGCGIPEAILGRVFDPFFTTKDVGVGTGQGLAIARSVIVDKHGGTIGVETRVGEGTTFVIRLPLGDET